MSQATPSPDVKKLVSVYINQEPFVADVPFDNVFSSDPITGKKFAIKDSLYLIERVFKFDNNLHVDLSPINIAKGVT